jgi:hypothetical protein
VRLRAIVKYSERVDDALLRSTQKMSDDSRARRPYWIGAGARRAQAS